MKALLTLSLLVIVEDEEAAASKAIEMEKAMRIGMAHGLEVAQAEDPDFDPDNPITMDDLEQHVRNLGCSVTIIPELREFA